MKDNYRTMVGENGEVIFEDLPETPPNKVVEDGQAKGCEFCRDMEDPKGVFCSECGGHSWPAT